MFDKLLVANDGSQGGERAFQCALKLAKRLGVALEMICAEEPPRHPARIEEVEETRADASGPLRDRRDKREHRSEIARRRLENICGRGTPGSGNS